MMPGEILDLLKLNDKTVSPMHKAVLDHVEKLLKPARERMQGHYTEWDLRHEVYMRRRTPDKQDIESIRQGIPRKISVPFSYSQIQTFVAYGYMLYTQRPRFYEYTPTEDMDHPLRECAETLIHRDMLASNHKQNLVQRLLDVGRFGMGCEVDSWEQDVVYLPIQSAVAAPEFQGRPTGAPTTTSSVQRVVRREGNCVRGISPYRVFTDPGFHLTDWQRGRFVAWDDEYSRESLQGMAREGIVAGVEHVEKYNPTLMVETSRMKSRFSGIDVRNPEKSDVVCMTQVVIRLVPAEIKDREGNPLGAETAPHMWLIWVANDSRIVRAEPMTNLHAQFPMSIPMFMPDMHESVLNSIAYMIDDLQSLVTWFMNSRMAAVSRVVDSQVVADPMMINTEDVAARNRIIRIQKAGAGKDIRRHFYPVQVSDPTAGHVGDMSNLMSMIQTITGVNDNVMGLVASGRRSATENRAANNGASSRLKLIFDVMWGSAYNPQANRLLLNSRQSISQEEFAAVCGDEKAAAYYAAYRADPLRLAKSYDFTTFDGTLPTEKLFLAQQLQELLGILLTNPMAAAAFNMDPNKVQKEIMTLRGQGAGGNFAFTDMNAINALSASLAMQNPPSGPNNESSNNSPAS